MKPRILVVEDEPSILESVLYALNTDGMEATGASTCAAGLEALMQGGIDLAIMDVGLPDGSGMELCKNLRRTSSIPVIFLTARASEEDRIVGLEIGGDDYVVKPFSPRELCARVKAVLRRAPNVGTTATPTAAPVTDGLQIDESRMQASYAGQALVLSATELKLLRVLSRHPGRVYSREQLMDRAWDDPGAALERTVDAHIKTLRQKLRSISGDKEFIVTHRGFGYSYQAPTP